MRLIFRILLIVLPCLFGQPSASADTPLERYQAQKDTERVPSQPFDRYFTTDKFGRRITFYVSEEPADSRRLPLVVYVQGSGCQSHFGTRGERIIPQNGHGTVADVVRGKARLVIVEKPGVTFLDTPEHAGGSQSASDEFRREHTLERWSEAVSAATKAARTLSQVDASRTLIIGHSEGGLVACKVAADDSFVTHVAMLAGGGTSQLFDLVELARQGAFAQQVSDDAGVRAKFMLDEHAKILEDPTSTTKEFLGHPYLRWATFLASSPMEELAKTTARIYVAQGGADKAVLPISARVLYAQLVAKGKDATLDWVTDADHSFNRKDKPDSDGWKDVLDRTAEWYLNP